MGDKELIEKIKSLSFIVKGTASERREQGFKRIDSAADVDQDNTIPDGYIFKDAKGKDVTIIHGHEDKRQVEEIIQAKQGG